MKTVILCGGMGTRLREETEYRPKSMVQIGGRPLLWHVMKLYANYGFTDFVLCLGYKGMEIKQYFLNYATHHHDFTIHLGSDRPIEWHQHHEETDWRITLVDTGLKAHTGARLKRVASYLPDDTFLLTYGDGVSDVDLKKLYAFHKKHGKLATVTTVRPISRFGVLELDDSNGVAGFNEKPQLDGWINVGFFVCERGVFDYLSDDPGCVLEQDPLRHLAKDGQLVAYRHDGFFYAMDTYREYKLLNDLWDSGQAPWKVWV